LPFEKEQSPPLQKTVGEERGGRCDNGCLEADGEMRHSRGTAGGAGGEEKVDTKRSLEKNRRPQGTGIEKGRHSTRGGAWICPRGLSSPPEELLPVSRPKETPLQNCGGEKAGRGTKDLILIARGTGDPGGDGYNQGRKFQGDCAAVGQGGKGRPPRWGLIQS